MTKICFTLCSNNYIAQASLLASSFLQHHPDYFFYIGLVDEYNQSIAYPSHGHLKILPCAEIMDLRLLNEMAAVYKIVELNTSVKPFYFDYFFRQHPECIVIYLDPDIYVYQPFTYIEQMLEQYEFIITPHCLSPIALDDKLPQERAFVKYGIFNLGFIALKKGGASIQFVQWLKERLAKYCYSEIQLGVYVDQSWINFLPVFWNNVLISKNPGLNCAYWNMHERTYHFQNNQWQVNNHPLIFFHFSALDTSNWQAYSKYQTRYQPGERTDILPLFKEYAEKYIAALSKYPSRIPCVYTQRTLKGKIKYYLNRYRIRKSL